LNPCENATVENTVGKRVVDGVARQVEVLAVLPSASDPIEEPAKPRPQGRRKYRLWFLLVVLSGVLVWLNGPGLRWLGPRVAGHFMGKAGLRGSFSIEGSITGGITVTDLHLANDSTLAGLTIKRVIPDYRFRELFNGKLNGIAVDGLHVDIRLGMEPGNPALSEKSAPFDLDKFVSTLRDVRQKVIPFAINLSDISCNVTRDGKSLVALAPSSLRHKPGATALYLRLGCLTDSSGKVWPAQETIITWNPEKLSLDRLDPLPGIGIRELVLHLPVTGGPSAETEIHLDDAVLVIATTPGFSSARINLREGRVLSEKIAESFALEIPAKAALTSLSVNVEGLMPDPKAATGAVRLLLEDVGYEDWKMPELSLDLGLESSKATLAASGQVLDTGFSINAEAVLGGGEDRFVPVGVSGHFNVAEVSRLVAALSSRIKVIDPAAPVPRSMVDGHFSVAFKNLKPASADLTMVLKPENSKAVSPVFIESRFDGDKTVNVAIELEGGKVKAGYHLESGTYDAKVEFEKFQSSRVDSWLAIVKAETHGAVALSGHWSGSGAVKENQHRGDLIISGLDVTRENMPPVNASGEIHYDWPDGFLTRNLKVVSKDQFLTLDARLADGLLDLSNLSWNDGITGIASGSVKLPVPEDFSKWREMLVHDKRPLAVAIDSQVLSLGLLKDWLPAAAKLDAKSTGHLKVMVSGTYAAPEIDLLLEMKNLRSPEQPKLPPADLIVKIAGRNGILKVEGKANTPDYPPALMSASMPFRPTEWAEKPELIQSEKLTARVDLARIDLSRFGSLVADARKVSGFLAGNVEVAGQLSRPAIKGKLDITGAGIEMKDNKIPPITGMGASVDLALDKVTLSGFKASLASGTIQGRGSLAIVDGKPGALDFRITGNHLPLMRNESLIVRANTDLRLVGTLEKAALTGTVGVVDSLFYRDIELLPIGSPFTGPSAAALPRIDAASASPTSSMPEPFRNWTIDVWVRTENPFLIRGNIATGKVDVNLRVGGTFGTPAPNGEVKISRLKAALPFSTLMVDSGYVRFTPATGLDPILEIRGSAEPRPYRVNMFAYGRASNPQLVLTSTPPLPENEIMTLLATGTTTSGLENPQAASSRAMQLLAEELRRGRFIGGKTLRPVLGLLDRVDFSLAEADPYSSDSFSTATISLTDKWFVAAGVGAEGDSRLMGIWRISFR